LASFNAPPLLAAATSLVSIDHQLNAHEENPGYYEAGRESDDETGGAQPDPGAKAPQSLKADDNIPHIFNGRKLLQMIAHGRFAT
jgi:hypothetical protein